MTIEVGFDPKHGEDESVLVFLKTREAGCPVVVDTLQGECADFVQGVIQRLVAATEMLRNTVSEPDIPYAMDRAWIDSRDAFLAGEE